MFLFFLIDKKLFLELEEIRNRYWVTFTCAFFKFKILSSIGAINDARLFAS